VIIPTFNNEQTLAKVIEEVLSFTGGDLIVVNDGSTDSTRFILDRFHSIHRIDIPVNHGKGNALRTGFRKAIELGYRYAITIDSDGQHYPDDLEKFITAIKNHPGAMIVGARNMEQQSVPGTSNFGHKFSIFWFKVETGLNIPDVQSGYRLYPLENIDHVGKTFSTKYEYEVEILVRLAWIDTRILSVPVKVYYAPKEERVSHFRKFHDFARVSVANSFLVFIALLWVRPLKLLRYLRRTNFREILRQHIFNSSESNFRLALSVSLGLFISVMPIWGWQMIVAFGLAHLFRLNKFVAVAASNLSMPPMLPFIIFGSFVAGGWALGRDISELTFDSGISWSWIGNNLLQYIVGSFVLGVAMVVVLGPVTWAILAIFRKKHG
jgi:glycosyltransferase involved in cell wall biosynthesis